VTDDTNDAIDRADLSNAEPTKRRWLLWAVVGVVAAVALLFAGIFFYANVINDSPDELDTEDLVDALVTDTTSAGDSVPELTAPPATDASPTATDAPPAPADTAPDTGAGLDGDWVPTDASEFGYRVEEVLAGVNTTAVGRSNEIDGLLTIAGTTATALEIEVQVASILSDDSLRDGQFAGRIMNTDEFPTATFVLTEPIEFATLPADGEQITASATGDLTLRGATNNVTFEVTAQTTDGRIGVLGSIPVVFADYGIDNPSFGPVSTEDNGLVEFVLVFERA
jgi:polyisoprenoid-binding protein YceI